MCLGEPILLLGRAWTESERATYETEAGVHFDELQQWKGKNRSKALPGAGGVVGTTYAVVQPMDQSRCWLLWHPQPSRPAPPPARSVFLQVNVRSYAWVVSARPSSIFTFLRAYTPALKTQHPTRRSVMRESRLVQQFSSGPTFLLARRVQAPQGEH